MKHTDYLALDEMGRGAAREGARRMAEKLAEAAGRLPAIEAVDALRAVFPDATRITVDFEPSTIDDISACVRSIYGPDDTRLWSFHDDNLAMDDAESTVSDFLASARERGGPGLFTWIGDDRADDSPDGNYELVIADLLDEDDAEVAFFADLNLRSWSPEMLAAPGADTTANGTDVEARLVFEVRGITIHVGIHRAGDGGTTNYTQVDIDTTEVPDDRRPAVVSVDGADVAVSLGVPAR